MLQPLPRVTPACSPSAEVGRALLLSGGVALLAALGTAVLLGDPLLDMAGVLAGVTFSTCLSLSYDRWFALSFLPGLGLWAAFAGGAALVGLWLGLGLGEAPPPVLTWRLPLLGLTVALLSAALALRWGHPRPAA
ncbi:hypothetical protein DAERI_060028 [Deinococcus aerius]|uniref:Uncharacterized protein n=1 Tax=Deinococcus aerius TaxID=200253 RepID=A0A2I9DHR8_9DEIO|nr:hypothetical protein [Deinococcus aerius]GBF05768.1 hypothetical protein DAERI_060028 [Deinococcus aerius]